jgi:hypothetical protein
MSSELKEIQVHVWRRLGIRRLLAGKKTVMELAEIAVANWDEMAVSSAKDAKDMEIVAHGMMIGIKRTHQMLGDYELDEEYGFVWVILLQALASAIVQILIRWWQESRENRLAILLAKKELVG